MYEPFYGFKEKPFKLTPDPAFLFLSTGHEDAWAHLKYAISQNEGFMVITGEVGTGKTTLCRSFLDQLDDTTHVAYIFNPKMDARQLLQAVNDELGLTSQESDTVKVLMDRLNRFLLDRKAADENVLLLIDEAQNLSVDVLEQLRLLSNLETAKDKLLLIVLVGQPELNTILETHELRQLTQRISLYCRLSALNLDETSAYIASRCSVAAQKSIMPFTGTAVRMIHRFSGGIPRLINLACDRALLIGFNQEESRITKGIVKKALGEVSGNAMAKLTPSERKNRWYWGMVAVLLLLLALGLMGWQKQTLMDIFLRKPQANVPPVALIVEPPIEILPKVEPDYGDLTTLLTLPENQFTQNDALLPLLVAWEILPQSFPQTETDDRLDEHYFQMAASMHDLRLLPIQGPLEVFIRLNHPGVLVFQRGRDNQNAYLTCVELDLQGATAVLVSGNQRYRVPLEQVNSLGSGMAYIFWKDYLAVDGTVNQFSSDKSVLALQRALNNVGQEKVSLTGDYDAETRHAVWSLQWRFSLPADGIAGPETQMLINQLYSKGTSPKLYNLFTSSVLLERTQIKATP